MHDDYKCFVETNLFGIGQYVILYTYMTGA